MDDKNSWKYLIFPLLVKRILYICHVSKLYVKYVIGWLALLHLLSCSNDLHCIMPSDVKLRAGDLVFRRGGSLSSRAVVMADTDKGYSHVGMVVDSAGKAMIVHAVPYEPDFEGDIDRVKLETPKRFFLSDRAIIGEVRRLEDWKMAKRASLKALAYYRRHTAFDHDYNTEDSTKVYCTELVLRAYREAGLPLGDVRSRHITLPTVTYDCILPSAFSTQSLFKQVRTF